MGMGAWKMCEQTTAIANDRAPQGAVEHSVRCRPSPGDNRNDRHNPEVEPRRPLALSLRRCLAITIALIGPSLLPPAASAVPIQSIQGAAGPATGSAAGGPRRPGSIPSGSSSRGNGPIDTTAQRGRPVPVHGGTQPAGKTLAEATPLPVR